MHSISNDIKLHTLHHVGPDSETEHWLRMLWKVTTVQFFGTIKNRTAHLKQNISNRC